MADRAGTRRNTITYLGDGGTTCPGHNAVQYASETIRTVAEVNAGKARINVIALGSSPGEAFLRAIAEGSGGTFVRILE